MTTVWFITGASGGLGSAIAEAALRRGDRVALAARDISAVRSLADRFGDAALPVQLDVIDRNAATAAVECAKETFGRLDVVCNSAGQGILGAIEETPEAAARAQFDVNFFGALWVTQAALPHFRFQRSGHLIQISSVGGILSFPMVGFYCASKWALEAMSESLAGEVSRFGIKVTLVEPGALRTDWPHGSMRVLPSMDAYAEARADRLEAMSNEYKGLQPGDPRRVAAAVLQLVDAEDPPLRVLMGSAAYDLVGDVCRRRLSEWASWETLSRATDFDQ